MTPCQAFLRVMRDLDLEQRTRTAVAAAFSNAHAPSEAAIARHIGLDRQTVNVYAKGEQTPRLDIAAQIAEGLGITLDQLAGRAPLPDRSPEPAQLAWKVRDLARIQEGLERQLQDVASQLELLGDRGGGEAAGTG